MSGYLPPRGTGGQCSEVLRPEYRLIKSEINGREGEDEEHYLSLPDGVVPTTKTLLLLGPSASDPLLKFQPIGFGLWGWGDVLTYGWGPSNGYDKKLNESSVKGAWDMMWMHCDRLLIDTAEHYGYTDGFSEKMLGDRFCETQDAGPARDKIVYATKYFPTPWRHPWKYPQIILNSLRGSLERTRLGHVDIYQLHGPSHWGVWPRLETICVGLREAYETGDVKAIGVCNLSFKQTKYIWSYLRQYNIPLISNQVEFSLVRQDPWRGGLISNCHKLGIAVIAYSPLAVGRLSGKYSGSNHPRGNRNFGHVTWTKLQPIVDELTRIGEKVGKTPSAVALNWVICKGAIPIPTPKNEDQVEDCLQSLGWRLSKEDEDRLDVLGLTNDWDWNLLKHFQNWWWQQG